MVFMLLSESALSAQEVKGSPEATEEPLQPEQPRLVIPAIPLS
jgi:hypothetical protein